MNTGQLHPGPAVGPPTGAPANMHQGAAAGGPAVSGVEHPAAVPRAPGAGGVSVGGGGGGYSKGPSGSLDMIALGLTIFLVVWQIILMAIAGRVLDRINDIRRAIILI